MLIAVKVRNLIVSIADFFYPYFSRFMPRQTFLYLMCGGGNLAFDNILYFLFFHYALHESLVDLGFVVISPHIFAFLMSFCITFPTGFLLNKYVTFTQSDLRGRVQLFRYSVTVAMCIVQNYLFIKLFVEVFHWYPTISKVITSIIVTIYSYLSQKHYTFRTVKDK